MFYTLNGETSAGKIAHSVTVHDTQVQVEDYEGEVFLIFIFDFILFIIY